MRNRYSSTDEDPDESKDSIFQYWWRRSDADADENSPLKLDLSDISKLTPRLKLCRELERLALISQEGLDDLRHKLITYRSGDFWMPVGGIKKEDMDIPPIISILLVGLTGSGKSSLVNLMYSVLGRSGLVPFAQTSRSKEFQIGDKLEEKSDLLSCSCKKSYLAHILSSRSRIWVIQQPTRR